MNQWQILRYGDYREMRWKNGAGTTREIVRYPEDGNDFQWRLSMATVSQSGAFSTYSGYHRLLSVLSGGGMRLHIDDAPPVSLRQFESVAFSGDSQVDSQLIDGPLLDFNLIYRSEEYEAQLSWRAGAAEPQTLDCYADVLLIFSAGDRLDIDLSDSPSLSLGRYDCALLQNGASFSSFSLYAEGYWAIVELRSRNKVA
ncbi:Various environmental stresses-induced protein [Leminorella richardii]|uniref:Various environmental stresses-induced protein n=1 Tax=Leminorella richardii TaxID=158841 RepID=A0A2X4Y037_9GAMM|nr:HutD family protein [Leminorella richardii]SQI42144.1 Various environmental stresses-induced protein [Leminorella richardii]